VGEEAVENRKGAKDAKNKEQREENHRELRGREEDLMN